MQQLSPLDASFVYAETARTPMHIGSVAIYDPSTAPNRFVRFKDILGFIESRLPKARAFRQRLIRVPLDLDHPYWIEDPEFDLEFHVRHMALPKPGDARQLAILTARLHARPLDMSKPLWELNVVEGLDNVDGLPPGCFALILKVHHAAVDGVSGVEMSNALHDLEANPAPASEADPWKPENMPRVADLLTRSYVSSLIQPMRVAETLRRSLPGMSRLGEQLRKGTVRMPGGRPIPRTRLNGKVGAHRVWDTVLLSLDEIRAIKDVVPGATVNDVVLGCRPGASCRPRPLPPWPRSPCGRKARRGLPGTGSRPWPWRSAPIWNNRWTACGSFIRTRSTPRPLPRRSAPRRCRSWAS
jgi:WS/DGAT/MGAT family acyltransferase